MSERDVYISLIVDYSIENGLNLAKPRFGDLPGSKQSDLMRKRFYEDWIEDWGWYDTEGNLVYVGGKHPVNEHTAEVFLLPIDTTYKKTMIKVCRIFCDLWIRDYDRLQSVIDVDNQKSYRFIQLLGFEKESVIKKLKGHDCYMMRRLS